MIRNIRRLFVLVLSIIVVMVSSNVVMAANNSDEELEYYESTLGCVKYHIDEEGNPYIIENGEVLYVFIPSESNKVTDPVILEELNMLFSETQNRDNPPANYTDISYGSPATSSPVYSMSGVDFNSGTVWSAYLKYNTAHATLRIKTSNHSKKHFYSSVKIDFTAYFFDMVDYSWHSATYSNKDCSGPNGFGILVPFSIDQYGQFCFSSSNLNSADISVWTSPAS